MHTATAMARATSRGEGKQLLEPKGWVLNGDGTYAKSSTLLLAIHALRRPWSGQAGLSFAPENS